ncbi:MAG: hypothetical protein WBG90_11875 [Saonia sp.]
MKSHIVLFVITLISFCSFGQVGDMQEELLETYEAYTELPREIVYVHTNKTTYIKGEQMGFTAYTFDKESKKLSDETTNLYVTISDKNNIPIKQQLIKVDNGIAPGDFIIDSLFTSGKYTLKAYTNWMKNFQEQNFFVQAIEVIDPELEMESPNIQTINTTVDVQFLPEGGHLVANVDNTIGIAIKDSLGFGMANLEGELLDGNGNLLKTFRVNQLGLGKFSFKPEYDETYNTKIHFNGEDFSFPLPIAEQIGFAMHLSEEKDALKMFLKTNKASVPQLVDQNYSLLIHNGSNAKTFTLPLFSDLEIEQVIPNDLLFSGINILTVFDMGNHPIAEKLYFRYNGLSFVNSSSIRAEKENDPQKHIGNMVGPYC